MPKKKGSNKTGGRKRGSVNKTTALRRRVDVISEVKALVGRELDSIKNQWSEWLRKDPAGFAEFLVQIQEVEAAKLRNSLELVLKNRRVVRPEDLDWAFSRISAWTDAKRRIIEDHIDLEMVREARAESAERIPFAKVKAELFH